jgi:hypothetical protein
MPNQDDEMVVDAAVEYLNEYYKRGRHSEFASAGSALRAASKDNPRIHPCPTCKEPNKLTAKDVAKKYQCDNCANMEERGW